MSGPVDFLVAVISMCVIVFFIGWGLSKALDWLAAMICERRRRKG